MIESREQNDVAAWLKTYPNIQIVSRDGSRTYANAISEAHPEAFQISDRFHLVKGLTDYARLALQKLFQGRVAIPITDETKQCRMVMLYGTVAERANLMKQLRKNGHSLNGISQIMATSEQNVKKHLDMLDNGMPHAIKHTVRGLGHIEAIEKVRNRADMVRDLKSQGLNLSQISRKTGFTHETIRNYLSDGFSPINAHYGKQREGKLEPFRSEVLQLKSEGLKYREIHDIIKAKGYTGTQDAIRGFISKERRIHRDLATGLDGGARIHAGGDKANSTVKDIVGSTGGDTANSAGGIIGGALTSRGLKLGSQEFIDKKWLIRLLYKPIAKVKGITDQQLDFVLSAYPLYKTILELVDGFRVALKSKDSKSLDAWIAKVLSTEIPELMSFVEGIKSDIDAVKNAIIYDYSNGIAEGTINKIKVIKRIMYGRCQFSLLKSKCIMLSKFN